MSNLIKCDFCKREIGYLTIYHKFKISDLVNDREIDVCHSCYKKFVKSIKTEEIKSELSKRGGIADDE